jgi:hypothetical protein
VPPTPLLLKYLQNAMKSAKMNPSLLALLAPHTTRWYDVAGFKVVGDLMAGGEPPKDSPVAFALPLSRPPQIISNMAKI